jgi:superfamily II DNA helicase RecQ
VKDMVAFIRDNHVGQSGIIYTFSKKEADDVSDGLCNNGIVARSYHSQVNDAQKDHVQRSWMRNETQVVVATIAFGLVSTAHKVESRNYYFFSFFQVLIVDS